MAFCDKCQKESKVFLPYGPHNLCEEHFLGFFEGRVKKTTREQKMVQPKEKIAVGVSGGKDSATTLYLLHRLFSKTNEIEAVMIDEGIDGYRNVSLESGKKLCKELDVPFTVAHYKKEFGHSMQQIKGKLDANRSLGSTCSFCGVFRKSLLNSLALRIGAKKLATGHNLDDEVQSIAMNFFEANLKKMARQNTATKTQNGFFVQRIKPLMHSPEKEIIAYCAFKGIQHYSDECCPFSYQAKRNLFRQMLNSMETSIPGTKFSILRSFEQIQPLLVQEKKMQEWKNCVQCNNPSSSELCTVCFKLKQLRKQNKISISRAPAKTKTISCTLKYTA